ncbi:hypothetical protein LNQ52_28225 [Klebsiella pneumoniae subsp. pneumoniae]|nr:hypothetical protein [Klebsiella pneumoniae subsp. pneumoniae]
MVGTDHAAEAITGFFHQIWLTAAPTSTQFFRLNKRQGKQVAGPSRLPGNICIRSCPPPTWKTIALSLPDEVAPGVTYEKHHDDYLEGKTLDPSIAKTIEGWYLKNRTHAVGRRSPSLTISGKIVSPLPRPAPGLFLSFSLQNGLLCIAWI